LDTKSILNFFTLEFPCGGGEAFIENEIPYTASQFDKVFIYPFNSSAELYRKMPDNVEVIKKTKSSGFLSKSIWFQNLGLILKILIKEFFSTPQKSFFLKKVKNWNVLIVNAIQDLTFLKQQTTSRGVPLKEQTFYSFWMNEWALVLAIAKDKGLIKEFVIRSNGFDIFDERREGNYMPFRAYIYSQSKQVHINNQMGVDYVKSKNIYPEKVELSYLGTKDFGENIVSTSEEFTLVSCSRMVALKRVHLIAEILKHVDFKLKWLHIGAGPELEKVKKAAKQLPSNVEFIYQPRFDTHAGLIEFYKKTPINLFINISETEGLPVTIQEALSFGIPTLATDVGGTSEVVTEQTGILIKKEFDPKTVANLISEFKNSHKNTPDFRKSVREFWESNFKAEEVASKFLKQLTA